MDKTNPAATAFNRLYVGSLHFTLTEDEIRAVFESYGPLDFVNLHRDETGKSKGFAFVQYVFFLSRSVCVLRLPNREILGRYKNAPDAKEALEKMNGLEIHGRPVGAESVGYSVKYLKLTVFSNKKKKDQSRIIN
jgi:RNA recognition motif-containing protein